MDVTPSWHATPKTASQETDSLSTRLAMNRAGSHPVPLHTWIARLLTQWLPDGARVVDIGCGTGLLGAALRDEMATFGRGISHYLGVDPSVSHRSEFIPHCSCRIGPRSVHRFPVAGDRPVDVRPRRTRLLDVLRGDPRPRRYLDTLLSRLGDGGRLLICGPVDSNNRRWFETLRDACGVEPPERALHESYDYMNDVVNVVRRLDADIRVRRYHNSVAMSGPEVGRYWRSVVYHDPAFDAVVDEVFADGVVIEKEVAYLEVARAPTVRIRFFNTYVPMNTLYEDLVPHLVSHGHEVTIVSSAAEYRPGRRADTHLASLPGVRLVTTAHLGIQPRSQWKKVLVHASYAIGAVRHSLFGPKADVNVFLSQPPFFAAVWAPMLERLRSQPYCCVVLDVYPAALAVRTRVGDDSVSIRLLAALVARTLNRAQRVITVARCTRDRLEGMGVERAIDVVPYWIGEEAANPDPEVVKRVRSDLGWTDKVVVYYGGNVGGAYTFTT